MPAKIESQSYSLGIEELALAFGMINRPDIGRRFLRLADKSLTNEQMDSRLVSASHSMLAHGLVEIVEGSTPSLAPALQMALLPMAHFDRLLQIMTSKDAIPMIRAVYINHERKAFSCSWNDRGIVQKVFHADLSEFLAMCADLFADVSGDAKDSVLGTDHYVTMPYLNQLLVARQQDAQLGELLKRSGLPELQIKFLKQDLEQQVLRGSVLSLENEVERPLEEVQDQSRKGLIFLQGKQRCWIFEFDSVSPATIAKISLVCRKTFLNTINKLVD